jgi:hypothetical protein
MPTKKDNARETLLAELGLHKVEFESIRVEMSKWLESERQFLNFSIVIAGAGIGYSQIIGGQQVQIVLLLAALIFHVFLREMLESTRKVTEMSLYLVKTLIPRVNMIFQELGRDSKHDIRVLGWELQTVTRPFNIFMFIIQPTRYWIPVIAIIGLIITYLSNVKSYNYQIPAEHLVLIGLNLIYLISIAFLGTRFYRKYQGLTKK